MRIRFLTAALIFLPVISGMPSAFAGSTDNVFGHKNTDIEERRSFLLAECDSFLKKANWHTEINGNTVKAFRLEDQYDEMSVEINVSFSGSWAIEVSIDKNAGRTSKIFTLPAETVRDDARLKDIILSGILPSAVTYDHIGDYRKAYSSIFSMGYSRTSDDKYFYPSYPEGSLHFAWELEYDPSANIYLPEYRLGVGDYMSFYMFFDWDNRMRENYFNLDIMMFGKNRYSGTPENGRRIFYGFFNGLEYFRPGFSDSTVMWDQEIYSKHPYLQYMIWRVLQWNTGISLSRGASLYSAKLMIGAGASVGPSSLFYTGLTPEEEEEMSKAFRSIRYRKQNYYFSYSLPASLSLCADRVRDFRFEVNYNYYFFYPILADDLFDMVHVLKSSVGYYVTRDVMLNARYERWIVISMLNDEYRDHKWSRLVFEFRNIF